MKPVEMQNACGFFTNSLKIFHGVLTIKEKFSLKKIQKFTILAGK